MSFFVLWRRLPFFLHELSFDLLPFTTIFWLVIRAAGPVYLFIMYRLASRISACPVVSSRNRLIIPESRASTPKRKQSADDESICMETLNENEIYGTLVLFVRFLVGGCCKDLAQVEGYISFLVLLFLAIWRPLLEIMY